MNKAILFDLGKAMIGHILSSRDKTNSILTIICFGYQKILRYLYAKVWRIKIELRKILIVIGCWKTIDDWKHDVHKHG
jgi:hypothetical protein